MSSGKPEDFCWNDPDKRTFEWNMQGDANLTNMTNQETFEAVSFPFAFLSLHIGGHISAYNRIVFLFQCIIEFEFWCVNNSASSPENSFQYM
jgi:hypothetical protein